ncbi:MAG: chromate transporter, partial [Oscillospiraceae bacterium]|nr:chromate transporter [Oscillospiraceae bacterium]
MKELAELFWAFARVGLFTFGGGYAMLPMLRREVIEKHGWADEEQLLDWFAVAQCTPGIIAVNTATFVGAKQKKLAGAFAATLGVVTPSFLIILAVAAFSES